MMVTTLWSVSISIVPTISLWSQPSRNDYNLLTIILGMNNFWAASGYENNLSGNYIFVLVPEICAFVYFPPILRKADLCN